MKKRTIYLLSGFFGCISASIIAAVWDKIFKIPIFFIILFPALAGVIAALFYYLMARGKYPTSIKDGFFSGLSAGFFTILIVNIISIYIFQKSLLDALVLPYYVIILIYTGITSGVTVALIKLKNNKWVIKFKTSYKRAYIGGVIGLLFSILIFVLGILPFVIGYMTFNPHFFVSIIIPLLIYIIAGLVVGFLFDLTIKQELYGFQKIMTLLLIVTIISQGLIYIYFIYNYSKDQCHKGREGGCWGDYCINLLNYCIPNPALSFILIPYYWLQFMLIFIAFGIWGSIVMGQWQGIAFFSLLSGLYIIWFIATLKLIKTSKNLKYHLLFSIVVILWLTYLLFSCGISYYMFNTYAGHPV